MITDKEFLRIAVINSPHSLHGQLKISLVTDIIERFAVGNKIYVETKNGLEEFKVQNLIHQKGKSYLLTIEGITDITTAEKFKGCEIMIERAIADKTRNLLSNDEFYFIDLIGCRVYIENIEFGIVKDVMQAGSGDILIITGKDGKNHMIPFVESMVDTREISSGRINISPVEGLLDM